MVHLRMVDVLLALPDLARSGLPGPISGLPNASAYDFVIDGKGGNLNVRPLMSSQRSRSPAGGRRASRSRFTHLREDARAAALGS